MPSTTAQQEIHIIEDATEECSATTDDHSYIKDSTGRGDHTYMVNVHVATPKQSSTTEKSVYQQHKESLLFPVQIKDNDKLVALKLFKHAETSTELDHIFGELIQIPTVCEKIWQHILIKISTEIDMICGLRNPSVLRSKLSDIQPETFFKDILMEMHQRCPKVLQFLMMMACPIHIAMSDKSHVIAAMYSLAMYHRNNQLTAFQKTLTASCVRYSASNGLLGLMHTLNISIPEKTKLAMLDELGAINGKEVLDALRGRKTIKITVDNIDGRIKAYQVRVGSGNKDFHYTHWSVIIDRFEPRDLRSLSIQPRAIPAGGPALSTFFLSTEELSELRMCYAWLIKRILVEDIPALSAFSSAVPTVLNHKYRKVVDKPTDVYPMFVIMKDPKSLPNCVQIMDTILGTLQSLYASAGRGEEFETITTIPLDGDQLTRVTFDSARHLRAGTHTRTERLEQFSPVIEELFHVQQDLLEKIFKTFYTTETARESGSLANYRAVLHRTNANGQVKANGYEAHKDFLVTVTRALTVEFACELHHLETAEEITTDCRAESINDKKKWLDDKTKNIVDKIMGQSVAAKTTRVLIHHKGVSYNIVIPPEKAGEVIQVGLNGDIVQIKVPGQQEREDDLHKYTISLVRVALDFMLFSEMIRAGHIQMITILMKRFIPLFIGLSSFRSKYAIECVDFITKTECLLSEFDSVRVKLGLLVNRKGKQGKNKPADMQQENNIKLVKHVIRGLGAGKTDKAMMRVSKAAPVVSQLVNDLTKTGAKKDRHSKKSMSEDLSVLRTKLRGVRPFQNRKGRLLESFKNIPSNIIEQVDKAKLNNFISRHSQRSMNKLDLTEEVEVE